MHVTANETVVHISEIMSYNCRLENYNSKIMYTDKFFSRSVSQNLCLYAVQ